MRYAAAVGEGGARPRGEGGGGGGGGPARVAVRASRRWSSKLPGCWQESRCSRTGERASLVAGARSPACHGRRGVHVGRHRLRRSSARQRKRNRRCRAGWGIGVEIASPGYICEVLSTAPALHLAYFRGVRALIEDPPRISVRLGRSEEHTSELQSHLNLVCRLLLEKKNKSPTARRDQPYLSP